jgi:hypothetical protein
MKVCEYCGKILNEKYKKKYHQVCGDKVTEIKKQIWIHSPKGIKITKACNDRWRVNNRDKVRAAASKYYHKKKKEFDDIPQNLKDEATKELVKQLLKEN